ncbi:MULTISPECIES: hypothetical protein [Pseudomonas]|uniref:hypothetical protein n=1 Tax=Pseudomonas TaxID=286 RepID=UPI001C65CDE5|nr:MULTISPECIES: hypothetical protein [unclassified Pseudomonas]MBW8126583.1 hypothetical protein [Pseudomonas sp. LAP_36]MBW8135396.1 hypothetical protein [Pseudomonas sp. PAMC 26818]
MDDANFGSFSLQKETTQNINQRQKACNMKKGIFSEFGFASDTNLLGRLGSSIGDGIYIVLTALGTITLAFGGALAGNYNAADKLKDLESWLDISVIYILHPVLWMFGGAVLFIIGSVGTFFDSAALKKKIETLEMETDTIPSLNDAINSSQESIESLRSSLRKLHTELVTTHLKAACKNVGLSTHDRVSIYYEHGNDFYLLARYSQNPVYSKSNRLKFSSNQGVIGKAWQHKRHVERDCPIFEKKAEYLLHMEKTYGFKEAQALGFAMKSCRYVAVAISDADSHTGVIVFESANEDFFDGCDGNIERDIFKYCADYQGMHSKFLRDGLDLNREAHIKTAPSSVEKDFLQSFKGGMQ